MALPHRTRLVHVLGLFGVLALGGCRTAPTPANETPVTTPPAPPAETTQKDSSPEPNASPRCDALPEWRYEKIALPPEFAPTLPEGTEVLWFAPGMFEPEADDYFTYAFSLELKEDLPGPAALEPLLVEYYRGLMTAVAGSRDATPMKDAVVTLTHDGQAATIELSDEFTGGQVIMLHLRMSQPEGPARGCLRVLASARPSDDNWASLEAAYSCLCDSAP